MAAKAIAYFTKALNIYQEIDPEDPLIADTYIDLADAYLEQDDQTTANQYLDKARDIIELDLQFNRDDFNYYQSEDPKMAWSIAMDLIDNYENLAWTYELQDDEYTAKQYFDKAQQLKATYGE
jgi:tetratricopeptide (TPR) repeat protein